MDARHSNGEFSEHPTGRTPVRCALVYDFDGTLSPGVMHDNGLLEELELLPIEFWQKVNQEKIKYDADEILTYLRLLIQLGGKKLTRSAMQRCGKKISFYPGVNRWFDRINGFASARGISLEHFVISAGIHEILKNTAIAPDLRAFFACKFFFEEEIAVFPSVVVNYTTKTQFLFRINKGIFNYHDHQSVNKFIEPSDRPIPFERMIFLGDRETDIPSMRLVKDLGGHSIAVYGDGQFSDKIGRDKIHHLISEGRVNFVAPADYEEFSQLDIVVRGILSGIARRNGYLGSGKFR